MKIFTTLFDSNYLDKGLALYYSMERIMTDFRLYIFAFDDKCFEILINLRLTNAEVIPLKDFETEQMLKLKTERSKAEYCWTCTPISIEYVLDMYNVEMCTYIDADLYFFADPSCLLNEIFCSDKSVLITEHRFEDSPKGKKLIDKNGKYCVQFNAFKNDSKGRQVLSWWKDKCIEWCFFKHEDNRMGDQKYLDTWTRDFKGVHELQNLGGGLAYWNLPQYEFSRVEKQAVFLRDKASEMEFQVIFVHFQNLRYLPMHKINIKAGKFDKRTKFYLYYTYLNHVEEIRKMLFVKYKLDFAVTKSCSTNKYITFMQNYLMQYRMRSFSDLIDLDKIKGSKYVLYVEEE